MNKSLTKLILTTIAYILISCCIALAVPPKYYHHTFHNRRKFERSDKYHTIDNQKLHSPLRLHEGYKTMRKMHKGVKKEMKYQTYLGQ